MDKDLLRLVIIAMGALVILGMVLWAMYSNRTRRKKINFYDDRNPLDNIDPNLVVNTEDDDFDIVHLSTRDNDTYHEKSVLNPDYIQEAEENSLALDQNQDLEINPELEQKLDQVEVTDVQAETVAETDKEAKTLPSLLQLSIVAQSEKGFTGIQLLEACEQVGLVFGNVKVFERLDILGRVDYAVASMIEPGVFPGDNWDTYLCPGITFFMQPREVDDAAAVFTEMFNTMSQLSALLKGDILDQNRQPFTQKTMHDIKASLV